MPGAAADPFAVGTDVDGDGWATPDDCDDRRPDVHPDAVEWCDERDWNCDGEPLDAGVCALVNPTRALATHLTSEGHSAIAWPGGDLTGDGVPDLVVHEADEGGLTPDGGHAPAWLVFDGTSAAPWTYPDGAATSLASRTGQVEAETAVPTGDVDGDGYADLAAAFRTGPVAVHLGPLAAGPAWADEGDLTWTPPFDAVAGPFGTPLLGDLDLDGDGGADTLAGAPQSDRTLSLAVWAGGATLLVRTPYPSMGDATATGDLDGDGLDEAYVGEGVHYLVRGPDLVDGGWLPDLAWATLPSPDTALVADDAHPLGDWDGDGHPELVVAAPYSDDGFRDGGAAWVLAPHAGELHVDEALGSWVGQADDASLAALATLDFDGDGGQDLLLQHAGEWVLVPASGGLPGPATAPEGLRLAREGTVVPRPGADLDGDGDDELLLNEHAEAMYLGALAGWAVPWSDPRWW